MTLYDLIELIRKHLRILILVTVLGTAAGYGISEFALPPQYTSQGSIHVLPKNENMSTSGEVTVLNYYVKDLLVLFTSKSVKQAAALGASLPYSQIRAASVSVNTVRDSRVIALTVTTAEAELSQKIAAALLEEYKAKAMEQMNAEGVTILEEAEFGRRSGPNSVMNTALGAAIAFAGCFAVLFLIRALDNTIATSDDVKRYLDLPVLSRFSKIEDKAFNKVSAENDEN